MKHVFLDTSIYKKNNFNFEGGKLNTILTLISEDKIQLHSTSIIDNEIISNINEGVDAIRPSINAIIKDGYILRHTSQFKRMFDQNKVANKVASEINEKYRVFKNKANIINIPINIADIDEVFYNYFNELPPFSKRKKDEIPDAIILSSLNKWFLSNSEKCYIISTDKDMENYCKENDNLIYLKSIDQLMAIIADEEHQVKYKLIMRAFEEIEDRILDSVNEMLESHPFELSNEGDINDLTISDIQIVSEPLVTEIGEDSAWISFDTVFVFDIEYSVLDPTNSPYDNEVEKYVWKEYVTQSINGDQEITIEILLSNINFGEIKYKDIEIGLAHLYDDSPFFVDTWPFF